MDDRRTAPPLFTMGPEFFARHPAVLPVLSGVIDALPDPLFVLEPPAQIVLASRSMRPLLGLGELPDRSDQGTGSDPMELWRRLNQARDEEGTCHPVQSWREAKAAPAVRFGEDARWFRPQVRALPDLGLELVILRDVTQEREELERLRLMQREFLSAAAHKFATPLTAIKMHVHLLQLHGERNGSAELKPQLKALDHHINRLTSEVNEVLDLSQIRVGRLTLHRQPVDLVGMLRLVIQHYSLHRPERQVTLTLDRSYVIGMWDEPRLSQVFRLLIDNADRYSGAESSIEVSVTEEADRARVVIRDGGVGIPLEARDQIGQPYFRAENVKKLRLGTGLGLGLYLCRQILEHHGATIELESELNVGTMVSITLPRGVPPGRPLS